MTAGRAIKKTPPYQFVLDELESLRPTLRQMFGFTYVYLGERLLLSLRHSARQPRFNGVWLYTEAEHIASLRREFPALPRRCFWRSKRSGSGWVIIAVESEEFEEHASKACELILRGDRRVGRATRKSRSRVESQ
ncbi:MAG TPA: hypothetical protein VF546_16040 [Pyrinomonadaceae bacterium]|jgi:hypothetical protein